MHRDKFTEKLVRIIGAIEAKALLVGVRELYVFGSYSRGAIEPGDLDLILVHDPPSRQYRERLLSELGPNVVALARRESADLRRSLCKPGERVQIISANSLKDATERCDTVKPDDAILIWSAEDRDWRSKLVAIKPDENAGRAPRNHVVSLDRVLATLDEMETVVSMVEQERLQLTRIRVDSISLDLDPDGRQWLADWTISKVMGSKSLETLPYAIWWLQQHGVERGRRDGACKSFCVKPAQLLVVC